jgi:hypothetical protein
MQNESSKPVEKNLLRIKRSCVVCGLERSRADRNLLPRMVSITVLVYSYTADGKKLRAGKRISICQVCLIKALREGGPESELWVSMCRAISERLRSSYNDVLKEVTA